MLSPSYRQVGPRRRASLVHIQGIKSKIGHWEQATKGQPDFSIEVVCMACTTIHYSAQLETVALVNDLCIC